MSTKWLLQGVQREGFEGVWTPGRFWPSAQPIEVEVIEGDDEPTIQVDTRDGGKRTAVDPKRMTAKAFARIMKDPRISKVPAGGLQFTDALADKLAGLEIQLAGARAEIVRLQGEIAAKDDEIQALQAERDVAVAAANPEPPPVPAPGDADDLPAPAPAGGAAATKPPPQKHRR